MARDLGRGIRDGSPGVPRVSFTRAGVRDLERLYAFLQSKIPAAARRAEVAFRPNGRVIHQPFPFEYECRHG